MRLFFISFVAILMTVSFTACGGDSDNSTIAISSSGTGADNNQTPKDIGVAGQEVVLSPVGPFAAGEFGVIDLSSSDYPFADDTLFLDIRNQWERDYRGYPEGSQGGAVYEYREHVGNGQEVSKDKYKKRYIYKDFIQKVKAKVSGDIHKKIILICSSASRTSKAAKLLSENGFTNIYHVDGGLNSWGQLDLPLEKAIK